VQTVGPFGTHDVYELPFTPENVLKLYEKVENDKCQFVLKDLKTGEATDLSEDWGTLKEKLDIFCHKPFQYLFNADYLPALLKMQLRQKAVAQGFIKGVASDYNMQSSSSQSVGVE
jgi:hypothetical protein